MKSILGSSAWDLQTRRRSSIETDTVFSSSSLVCPRRFKMKLNPSLIESGSRILCGVPYDLGDKARGSKALWGKGVPNTAVISCPTNIYRATYHFCTQTLGFRGTLFVVSLAPSYCILVSQNKVADYAGVHGSDP